CIRVAWAPRPCACGSSRECMGEAPMPRNSTLRVRVQKTLQVLLVDRRLAAAHVVELSFLKPFVKRIHQLEDMLKRIGDKQQRLIMIDLKILVDHPFQLKRIALHQRAGYRMLDLAIAAEQT